MFRFYVHALRFTHLQTKISNLSKTNHTPKDKRVLPLPTHMRASAHPRVFQPSCAKTLLPRTTDAVRPAVDHTRDKGV